MLLYTLVQSIIHGSFLDFFPFQTFLKMRFPTGNPHPYKEMLVGSMCITVSWMCDFPKVKTPDTIPTSYLLLYLYIVFIEGRKKKKQESIFIGYSSDLLQSFLEIKKTLGNDTPSMCFLLFLFPNASASLLVRNCN